MKLVPASPSAPTKRDKAKAKTRDALKVAGKHLILMQGVEGATIRDITASAGFSTGAFFASWSTKEELVAELTAEDPDVRRLRIETAIEEIARVAKVSPNGDAMMAAAKALSEIEA